MLCHHPEIHQGKNVKSIRLVRLEQRSGNRRKNRRDSLLQQIWNDILHTSIYWQYALIPAGITFILSVLKKQTVTKTILLTLFVFYLAVLAGRVFVRETGETRLNLVPFSTLGKGWRYFIENILLFIPLGILFPLIFPKQSSRTILFGMLISILIEALQYILHVGRAEIDDLIANTAGTVIGFVPAFLIRRKIRTDQSTDKGV